MTADKDEKAKEPGRHGFCVSRYPGQRLLIQGGIVIRVSEVKGDRVYIQVEAPEDVRVQRPSRDEDKSDRIKREQS